MGTKNKYYNEWLKAQKKGYEGTFEEYMGGSWSGGEFTETDPTPTTYTLEGDYSNWSSIAKEIYGDERMVQALMAENPDYNRFFSGLTIKVPKQQKNPYISYDFMAQQLENMGGEVGKFWDADANAPTDDFWATQPVVEDYWKYGNTEMWGDKTKYWLPNEYREYLMGSVQPGVIGDGGGLEGRLGSGAGGANLGASGVGGIPPANIGAGTGNVPVIPGQQFVAAPPSTFDLSLEIQQVADALGIPLGNLPASLVQQFQQSSLAGQTLGDVQATQQAARRAAIPFTDPAAGFREGQLASGMAARDPSDLPEHMAGMSPEELAAYETSLAGGGQMDAGTLGNVPQSVSMYWETMKDVLGKIGDKLAREYFERQNAPATPNLVETNMPVEGLAAALETAQTRAEGFADYTTVDQVVQAFLMTDRMQKILLTGDASLFLEGEMELLISLGYWVEE